MFDEPVDELGEPNDELGEPIDELGESVGYADGKSKTDSTEVLGVACSLGEDMPCLSEAEEKS